MDVVRTTLLFYSGKYRFNIQKEENLCRCFGAPRLAGFSLIT